MSGTVPWRVIVETCEERIAAAQRALETADPANVRWQQGYIKALRDVLAIPQTIGNDADTRISS